jgi:hypothetical protein
MLSAHYLNDGVYRYPAAGLYPGDIGIDTLGTTPGWNGYNTGGPVTNNNLLAGVRSKFHRTYPAELVGSLYDYGADVYEFVSGQDGRLTFGFSDTASGVRLRVIRYHLGSNVQPRIDGYADDWAGRNVVSATDPANDNNRLNTGGSTNIYASAGVDLTNISGIRTNDILYLCARVREPDKINDTGNWFVVKIDVSGDDNADYYLYHLSNGSIYLYTTAPYLPVYRDLSGMQCARTHAYELALPLTLLPDYAPEGTVSVYFYAYTSGSPNLYDYPLTQLYFPP